ncbi:MAG: hypothetical protein ACLFU7_01165 [Armatimonadota bacterium]
MRRLELIFVLLLATVAVAGAQEEVVINHLSTDAILHEDGVGWHVRARFTTSVPAVCHVESGPSPDTLAATEPESEALRNHRFDIPAEGGVSRFLRINAATEGAETASEVIEVAPPPPFPTGEVERVEVPLTVEETAGVARNEPVTVGIPLPEGALGRPSLVSLMDGSLPIPVQTRALVRWPDRSIKWLLVSGNVTLEPNETKTLTLTLGTGVRPHMLKGNPLLAEDEEAIAAWTGQTRLTINRETGEGAIEGPQGALSPLPISRLVADDGEVFTGRVESVVVEEAGYQRAVILARGHHVNDVGEPYFGFELRYFLHAGDPFVRIDHVLQHDIVSADMEYGDEMKSFRSLDLIFPTEADTATLTLKDGDSAQIAPGERLFQHESDAYELSGAEGQRAPGLATAGDLTVAVRDFWQNWPKAISVEEEGLALGLYPQITPADRYVDRPNEHVLYYYIRDGKYTFRSGFEKRHELLIGPSDAASPERALARVNEPLLVTAPPEWYIESGALHTIAGVDGRDFEAYDEVLSEAVDAHVEVREENDWFGLMNFGDWFGERRLNWGNIEYDLQHAMLTQYFRTGDRRFFDLAEDAARHNADVDVVHFAAGQNAGPGNERRVGQAWVHSMGHTGGYYPYDYMNMSIYAQGYAENEGHMWNQGNLEYWLLTGDRQVQRAAMQLADWAAGPNTVDFGYGNARVPGWMGIIAMSTWFATHDPYYLNAMHLMYEEVQEKADPDAGLWVHKLGGGHCRCDEPHYGEAGFMSGVLMTSLKYYHLATGDEEVADRIVKIANWLVENLYEPEEDSFRYTACPHTWISSTSPMIMGNGLAFAANYSDDEDLMELARRTFLRGFIAFSGGSAGKSIASSTSSAPMAIHEISKFPGPTLDELHSQLVEAAHDPARRRLPAIVPNPNFERDLGGWTVRSGLTLTRSTDVAHTGEASAMAEGTIEGQNEYFVTRYSCGPPWEIMWLEPGEDYRMQLWLRIDDISDGAPPPTARLAVRNKGVTKGAFATNEYDLSRLGEWQLLETEFTVPDGTDAAYIAVSSHTHDPVSARMYLDDVAIVPASAERRDTCVWSIAEAVEATPDGGVSVVSEGILDGWDVLATSEDASGSATFTLDLPLEDEYALMVRAKGTDDDPANLEVTLDGEPAGEIAVTGDGWSWITAGQRRLDAGAHSVTIGFPAGSGAMIHSVLLTNQ